MNDTTTDMETVYQARLMALSGETRFLMGARMYEAAREMVLSSLPQGMTVKEIRLAILERFYGNDLDEARLREIEQAIVARNVESVKTESAGKSEG